MGKPEAADAPAPARQTLALPRRMHASDDGKTHRNRPRCPEDAQERVLAHSRKDDDHNGPRKQVGCLEQKLCLVDALANGAGGHADELGRDAGLPRHAHDRLARRTQIRQRLGPHEAKRARGTAHAVDVEQLSAGLAHVVEPLEHGKVEPGERHEKHRCHAHVGRAKPDEQQHHDAHDRRGLHGHERRPRHDAHEVPARRGKRQRDGRGVGRERGPDDAQGGEAHLCPEWTATHKAHERRGDVDGTGQDELLPHGHACRLPDGKPQGNGRHALGRRPLKLTFVARNSHRIKIAHVPRARSRSRRREACRPPSSHRSSRGRPGSH